MRMPRSSILAAGKRRRRICASSSSRTDHLRYGSSRPAAHDRLQHDGVIDLRVTGAIEQRDTPAACELAKLANRRIACQLTLIAPAEFLESFWPVVEPDAQIRTG